jgi:NADPH:quinone reductase-like Zn-dependent oxidoreductase
MAIPVQSTMAGVQLTGHGGPECLDYREDLPIPSPSAGEVLIRVGAAGINNTDINTRVGWYTHAEASGDDTTWSGAAMTFPRIQGADCCGRIVAVGAGVDPARVGQRVLVRTMQDPMLVDGVEVPITLGSEIDGAFAQYVVTRASETFPVTSTWSDAELASIPCAYSTAEGLLHRAGLRAERVLVTGASGGVGSAAVQLAKRRGAHITAIAHESKAGDVLALGADAVIDRGADLVAALGPSSVDVVIDVVGGAAFPSLLTVLRPRGRYAVAGAVGGPRVDLDLRDLYLKDLTLLGCTFHERSVFADLVGYVERDEIRPVVAATFALNEIAAAQQAFLDKRFTGKLVLVPPG